MNAGRLETVAVLLATASYGPQVTPDSVFYLSTAENLRAGHGLVDFNGYSLTTFPRGFPFAIAAGQSITGSGLGVVKLTEVARVADGALYRVRPSP